MTRAGTTYDFTRCDECGAELEPGNFWGICGKCEEKPAAQPEPRRSP